MLKETHQNTDFKIVHPIMLDSLKEAIIATLAWLLTQGTSGG